MKKILILSVIFLFGICSVSAQNAWEVLVTWYVSPSSDCNFEDLVNDRFVVFITIEDDANDVTVVDNEYNIEANDADESTFNVQNEVQGHCNDTTLNNTPDFIIYTTVRMVHIPTQYVYCFEKSTNSNFTCSHFSSGIQLPLITFD